MWSCSWRASLGGFISCWWNLSEISDKRKCKQKSHSSGNMIFISVGKCEAVPHGKLWGFFATDFSRRLGLLSMTTAQRGAPVELQVWKLGWSWCLHQSSLKPLLTQQGQCAQELNSLQVNSRSLFALTLLNYYYFLFFPFLNHAPNLSKFSQVHKMQFSWF